MKVTYTKCYREHAHGYLTLDKPGSRTIQLTGAAAMTQEELDLYGEIMAVALANMTEAQRRQAMTYKGKG